MEMFVFTGILWKEYNVQESGTALSPSSTLHHKGRRLLIRKFCRGTTICARSS